MPIVGLPAHVRDGIDPNAVIEHAIREHEREAADHATPYPVL